MDLLDLNIALLCSDPRHHISPISNEDIDMHFSGQDQDTEFFVDNNGRYYAVQDRVDEKSLPDSTLTELIVVIGITGQQEIKELLKTANPRSRIVVIEPKLGFVYDVLKRKDLDYLKSGRVRIIAAPYEHIPSALESIFGSELIMLVSNLRIYATYYYRTYDLATFRKVVHILSTTIRYMFFTLGNDIEDSLIGLNNNLYNTRFILHSKDVSRLKGSFPDVPAFVVSAGPSLEKNMHQLKQIQNRGLIFAVDTILGKLLDAGIIPHFVCSIERFPEVFDYYYKDKDIPPDIALLSPSVIPTAVFECHRGLKIIPMRQGVREYYWLNDRLLKLPQDSFISMGASVAHLPFGFAAHLGASPIVLVGQDLAYAQDGQRSHSSGTIYDQITHGLENMTRIEVEGYHGGKILSMKDWVDFRLWFESEIIRRNLFVINATEGGARIAGTVQMPLQAVIEEYCKKEISIQEVLRNCPEYDLSLDKIKNNYSEAIKDLKDFLNQAEKMKKKLNAIKIFEKQNVKELEKKLQKMKQMDTIIHGIYCNNLLFHVFQPYILNIFMRFYRIPNTVSIDTVSKNLDIQQEFMTVVCNVLERTISVLEKNYQSLPYEINAFLA